MPHPGPKEKIVDLCGDNAIKHQDHEGEMRMGTAPLSKCCPLVSRKGGEEVEKKVEQKLTVS